MTTVAPRQPPSPVDFLFEKIGFSPTPEQKAILDCPKRFVLVAGGDQSGKSLTASKFLGIRIFQNSKPGLYWLVAADYDRTKREFDYILDDFTKLGLVRKASKRVDPGYIELHDGTKIETKSGKDPRTLAMYGPDGIVGCEASQLDIDAYWRLLARTAPNRGWLFLSGTFEGSLGWYPSLYNQWLWGSTEEQAFSLPSWTNTALYPGGRVDPEILRIERTASDDFFMERMAGVPSPPRGLVFREFQSAVHVRPTPWVEGEDVYVCIDPGYAGAFALEAVQEIDGQIRVFDEIYEQGLTIKDIAQIAMQRPWWQAVRGGAIDIASTQHNAMAAPIEVWVEETSVFLHGKRISINDGTERLKGFLKVSPIENNRPNIVFDPRCVGVLSELGHCENPFSGQTQVYSWKMDREGNIVGNQPEDKFNHGVKALIYWLVDKYGYVSLKRRSVAQKRWS